MPVRALWVTQIWEPTEARRYSTSLPGVSFSSLVEVEITLTLGRTARRKAAEEALLFP